MLETGARTRRRRPARARARISAHARDAPIGSQTAPVADASRRRRSHFRTARLLRLSAADAHAARTDELLGAEVRRRSRLVAVLGCLNRLERVRLALKSSVRVDILP